MPANTLIPHPANYRRHPPAQQRALRGVLAEIGFADALIARETPDGLMLLDGHLRQDVMGDALVPVLVLDLTEAEGDALLATLDPLAAMAQHDQEALLTLLESVHFEDAAVNDLLEALANDERQPMPDFSQMGHQPNQAEIDARSAEMAETFAERSRQAAADHIALACPQCGAEFSISRSALDTKFPGG